MFFLDFLVRAVDGRQLVGRHADEFFGHAARDQLVGMVLAHQHPIGVFDLVFSGFVGKAQDRVRIACHLAEMRRADAAEFAGRETEDLRNGFEEFLFARMQKTIGLGDFEQTVEDVFQHRRIAAEHARDLPGIGFVTRHVLPGEVEHAVHIGPFGRRHLKDALERGDLIIANDAVGLRHFRGEADDRDGKRNAGIACIRFLFLIEENMPRGRAQHRPHRTAAEQKARRGARYFSPDGHGRNP